MRFQRAHNLPLGRLITEAGGVGQDLRPCAVIENYLAKAVEALRKELGAYQKDANGRAPVFSLRVEGAPQDLPPHVRDEIYRIAGEALRNAFRHARARQIEVEIRYDARHLRVRVRDDGIGIGADVLSQEGRAGHFGFTGMRERAKAMGGQLEVWSEHGAGTEVELTLPALAACRAHAPRHIRLITGEEETIS